MPAIPTLRPASPPPRTDPPPDTGERRRVWLLTLSYLCILVVGVINHEMWRDEWQAWMLARDSGSVMQLLHNMEHEGHPPGWYLLLYGLSRLTRDPLAMQALHVAIATTSVYILVRFSPLPWLYRVLIAFGYFIVFEYAVIARSYSVIVLALFAFCALFRVRRRHAAPLVASLAVLATVSVYGLILSIAASCALLYERFGDRDLLRKLNGMHLSWKVLLTIWVIVATGAVIVMRPPQGFSGRQPPPDRFTQWGVAASAATLAWAYAPVPDVSAAHVWNTHVIPDHGKSWLVIRLALAVLLATGALLLFARQPSILLMYTLGTGGLLLFQHAFFIGTLRHHGHLFILFITCLWLAHGPTRTWRLPRRLHRITGVRHRTARAFIVALLFIQCIAGALLYIADLRQPFSTAALAAGLIRQQGLDELPIAVSPGPGGSSLAGALDRPVFYIATQSESTFITWGQFAPARDRLLDMPLLRMFIDAAGSDEVVIVLGAPFNDWDDDLIVEEAGRFEAGVERTEGYVIYHVRRRHADLATAQKR